jgi:ADP-ribose pyrophosphatase YjhB (NUDIX family)
VSAGVVVLNDEGCVLLLNHVLRPASGWGAPGGFLNPNEQPADTARREVFEETGLELEDLKLIKAQTVHHHVEFWFRGRANGSPQIKTQEILEARWFRLAEMPPEMSLLDRRLIEETVSTVNSSDDVMA